jgi:hypothetical protein|tara:strand:- start:573 stop:767 length:195 start_codon:yes stop_codon:yes gene_type:complete
MNFISAQYAVFFCPEIFIVIGADLRSCSSLYGALNKLTDTVADPNCGGFSGNAIDIVLHPGLFR